VRDHLAEDHSKSVISPMINHQGAGGFSRRGRVHALIYRHTDIQLGLLFYERLDEIDFLFLIPHFERSGFYIVPDGTRNDVT